jgi:hypothetical protein
MDMPARTARLRRREEPRGDRDLAGIPLRLVLDLTAELGEAGVGEKPTSTWARETLLSKAKFNAREGRPRT